MEAGNDDVLFLFLLKPFITLTFFFKKQKKINSKLIPCCNNCRPDSPTSRGEQNSPETETKLYQLINLLMHCIRDFCLY